MEKRNVSKYFYIFAKRHHAAANISDDGLSGINLNKKLQKFNIQLGKKKIDINLYSYGEYTEWDRNSRKLPKIVNISHTVQAEIGTEFGYVLKIKRGKGKKLEFKVIHPPFKDENGVVMDDFTGEYYINSNDYEFFLGDCIWEPLDDKLGPWRLITYLDGQVIADKTLQLVRKES